MIRACLFGLIGACLLSSAIAQDRETKVRNDKKLLEASDFWIYNDLPKAERDAKRTKKPILVVFRCIPCEACHEFDEQVVEREPVIRELLDKFVCVRIPQANGLDLSRFQFDFDMSFAIAYLHHDGTLLGRFGTRTGRENEKDDMHLLGFADSMQRVLKLSSEIDQHRTSLAGKAAKPAAVPVPEEFPMLKGKYTDKLNYEGKVVQSCIHCHQIREAQRMVFRSENKPVPDELLFPWPGLSILGLKMNPETASTITAVEPGSIAAKAKLQPGDRLASLQGQPLVSVADAQWVLQNAGASAAIPVEVERNGERVKATLELPDGWRRHADISWRATTWDLRRMAFGGMVLEAMTDEERKEASLTADKMALRVKHVGQYGEHARAKQAGLLKDDIVISYDGIDAARTESELLSHAMQNKRRDDPVSIVALRGKERKTFTVKLQ
ncbi:MAG TPA: Trx7/PDZ domain-containing (seleno)protein [Planctomycetaceae bacterium]|nr:Trx7/PDZ domain-containing (seleno)protein [Planctomycetaceae bacterium]